TSTGRKRWTNRWKRALQAFDIAFDGHLTNNRGKLSSTPEIYYGTAHSRRTAASWVTADEAYGRNGSFAAP
ncbi:hypothetical protein ACIRD2_34240, partial [Streptomyces sp. NPDC093595]|uniref:hypothetical protein n=1 Tax=Streptomyces sp. NPDC093595 TaxID=3366045 RepID=UPI003809392F